MNSSLSFNWDIHWVCNYRCPYCWFNGQWESLKSRNVYPSPELLTAAWRSIGERQGHALVSITGGEPFLYPGFSRLIRDITEFHNVQIITNLSQDIEEFINANDPEKVKINPSFHPLFSETGSFMPKAGLLREKGFLQCVSYLAWPGQLSQLEELKKVFMDNGLPFMTQPFNGYYSGKLYPDSYTDEEKELIGCALGERGGQKLGLQNYSMKGKNCNAGRYYAIIHPDGMVLRCGGHNAPDKEMGCLWDKDFKLNDAAKPCTADDCPCNEWAFLLAEEHGK